MGCFDSFYDKNGNEVQLKAGLCVLSRYEIGDPCELDDGVYHALFDDCVVIYQGCVHDVGHKDEVKEPYPMTHYDKRGEPYPMTHYDKRGEKLKEEDE